MLRAFFSSATGMRAQELLIDNTANNLANVNTNGFKRSQLDFADLLYATHRPPGTEVAVGQNSPTGLQIGSGVRPVGTTKVFSTGVVQQTGNVTDVAIEGEGFFKILLPNGDANDTRGTGRSAWTKTGRLVTGDGYVLESTITDTPRTLPSRRWPSASDGTVTRRAKATQWLNWGRSSCTASPTRRD